MRNGRLTAILVAALVLVLVGGGTTAYLVGRNTSTAAAPASTSRPPSDPTDPTTDAPSSEASAPSTRRPTSAGPTPTPPSTTPVDTAEPSRESVEPSAVTAEPEPSTAPTDDTEVAIAGVASDDPQAEDIRDLLQRHFDSINDRDYAGWVTTVTSDLSDALPQEKWLKEYSTTRDTDINVIRIHTDPREVDITFRSRQDKALSPEGKYTCLNWQVTHPLTDGPDGLRIERSIESDADWRPCSTG